MKTPTERFISGMNDAYGMRPTVPFGTPIALGHVVIVDQSTGRLSHVGTLADILGIDDLPELPPAPGQVNQELRIGESMSVGVLAEGEASTLFPNLPSAGARIEVRFGSDNSVYALVSQPEIRKLGQTHRLYAPILEAHAAKHHAAKTWDQDWALITEIGTPSNVHAILSHSAGTSFLLQGRADVDLATAATADFAGSFSLQSSTNAVVEYRSHETPVLYNAIRVKTPFWDVAEVQPLSTDDIPEYFEVL
ncbi:hypothetical protein [Arthrobacter sp. B0490]|uniref:hypothetical protein n=1 Tax=Arthrobacter sp. B0490 TaxID=2058891 RepID=UPI0011B02D90|nr:hypothetical protein [Arthrobacter sp. B0490]